MFNTYLLSTYNDPESFQIIAKFQLMAAQCLKARSSMQNKDKVDSFIKSLETRVKQQVSTWSKHQAPSIGNVTHAQRPNKRRSFADGPKQLQDLYTQEVCSLLEQQQQQQKPKTTTSTSATTESVEAEIEAEVEAEETEAEETEAEESEVEVVETNEEAVIEIVEDEETEEAEGGEAKKSEAESEVEVEALPSELTETTKAVTETTAEALAEEALLQLLPELTETTQPAAAPDAAVAATTSRYTQKVGMKRPHSVN